MKEDPEDNQVSESASSKRGRNNQSWITMDAKPYEPPGRRHQRQHNNNS